MYKGPNGDQPVGYWPRSLFTALTSSASRIDIGGEVVFNKDDPSPPPMGSGHFPAEGQNKAVYVKDILFVDQDGILYKPNGDAFDLTADRRECYDIGGSDPTDTFYFGGPGGCKI